MIEKNIVLATIDSLYAQGANRTQIAKLLDLTHKRLNEINPYMVCGIVHYRFVNGNAGFYYAIMPDGTSELRMEYKS